MEHSLDFQVLFYMLRSKLVWIIASAVVGALIAFGISEFILDDVYTAQADVYISNIQQTEQSDRTSYNDLTAAKSMATTYCHILTSREARDLLRNYLKKNEQFNSSAIKGYAYDVSAVSDTEIVRITVTSKDNEMAALVCNTMIDVSKELITTFFPEGGRSIGLGAAGIPQSPSYPNTQGNMMLGILIGLVTSSAITVVWFLIDNRVKDEEDFAQKVKIPVLGEVPSMNETLQAKGGKRYYAYAKKQNN